MLWISVSCDRDGCARVKGETRMNWRRNYSSLWFVPPSRESLIKYCDIITFLHISGRSRKLWNLSWHVSDSKLGASALAYSHIVSPDFSHLRPMARNPLWRTFTSSRRDLIVESQQTRSSHTIAEWQRLEFAGKNSVYEPRTWLEKYSEVPMLTKKITQGGIQLS